MSLREPNFFLGKLDEVMRRWELRANQEVLCALQLESLALRDSLPELLQALAQILATASTRGEARKKWEQEESTRIGRKHGKVRADCQHYTMSQMICEYHILRQVICDVLEEDQALSWSECEVIVCTIEQAVNDAATQFSDSLKEAQERLASTLTHDLRAPLTVASLATQKILRRPGVPDFCLEAATRIARSIDRLETMIQSLLDASLLKTGQKLELRTAGFDIRQLANQFTDDYNLKYEGRLVVTAHVSGEVHWDKAEIFRLMENLTSNAAKYAKPDTPIAVALSGNDDVVTLSVHNEGDPIPASEHENLFRQFHRGSSARRHRSWGLGLTVVKGIVEAHRGEVRIESSPQTGTSFIVQIPRDARPAAGLQTPQ